MKVYCWVTESPNYNLAKILPGFVHIAEIDARGRRNTKPCLNNPDYRNLYLGLYEDYVKSYPVDGLALCSERMGVLGRLMSGSWGDSDALTCFCPHCREQGRAMGIDPERARRGCLAIGDLFARGERGERVPDGGFVSFWRTLLEYPEILGWDSMFAKSQFRLYRDLYSTVKTARPEVQVGWHVMHLNSFSPFYRAAQDYAVYAELSDFLKLALYQHCAGPRFARFVDLLEKRVFRGASKDTIVRLLYETQGLRRGAVRQAAGLRIRPRIRARRDGARDRRHRRPRPHLPGHRDRRADGARRAQDRAPRRRGGDPRRLRGRREGDHPVAEVQRDEADEPRGRGPDPARPRLLGRRRGDMSIRVSPCGHFFQKADGEPFFYLGDTVWMLFNKLKEEEARELFADRSRKGYTVIQSVVFRDLFTPNTPNAYGDTPFADEKDMVAVRMNPRWIAHVRKITSIAAEYGLIMGILPTWGDKWNEASNSAGPVIMDQDSARAYGRTLSDELADHENVIWILGGDSPILNQKHADIISAMAGGIRSGGSAGRLMTFHPSGMGSSEIFHAAPWLDFNALQTSHHKPNIPGYFHIERLYWNRLAKPCLDMEPNYEASPMFVMRGTEPHPNVEPLFSAYDVRKSLYRTVLAGAAGFTYGCEPIRQLYRRGDRVHIFSDYAMPTWREALSSPGSSQLGFLVKLLTERSYFTRVPAQELFLPLRRHGAWADSMATGMSFAGQENTDPVSHIRVARCSRGTYLLAYTPVRQVVTLDTSGLNGSAVTISLYDPERCELTDRYGGPNKGRCTIVPQRDLDTLIVVDAR